MAVLDGVLVRAATLVPVLLPAAVPVMVPVPWAGRYAGAWPVGVGDLAAWPFRRGGAGDAACVDGLPWGAADCGAEAWGGRPPAAPGSRPFIQVECRGAMLPKTAAAVMPTRVADMARVNTRRSLAGAARRARRLPADLAPKAGSAPKTGPTLVLAGPWPNRRLPLGTMPLFRYTPDWPKPSG